MTSVSPQSELAIRNARIVLPNNEIVGSVLVRDGVIVSIDRGAGQVGEDFEGDYLLPGFVELHTDQLEGHYRPRHGVSWNPMAALQAHDTQIAGSGITTVFDSVRIGSSPDDESVGEHAALMIQAIIEAVEDGRLRSDHLVHLRCELPAHDVYDHFAKLYDLPIVRLASLMDHTPGQRQLQGRESYIGYLREKMRMSDAEIVAYVDARQAEQMLFANPNRQAILVLGAGVDLPFASHDDTTLEHIDEAVHDGIAISEFPTTVLAARAAHAGGMSVLMGAPNIVRGKSHSGNVSAVELARLGCLDILSSDYVPFSLMQAVFMLPARVPGLNLSRAVAMVTSTPAKAANLTDRGEIALGKRADLVRVGLKRGMPVVRSVYRQGKRVS